MDQSLILFATRRAISGKPFSFFFFLLHIQNQAAVEQRLSFSRLFFPLNPPSRWSRGKTAISTETLQPISSSTRGTEWWIKPFPKTCRENSKTISLLKERIQCAALLRFRGCCFSCSIYNSLDNCAGFAPRLFWSGLERSGTVRKVKLHNKKRRGWRFRLLDYIIQNLK